jgi:IQ calmodulin-binding motif
MKLYSVWMDVILYTIGRTLFGGFMSVLLFKIGAGCGELSLRKKREGCKKEKVPSSEKSTRDLRCFEKSSWAKEPKGEGELATRAQGSPAGTFTNAPPKPPHEIRKQPSHISMPRPTNGSGSGSGGATPSNSVPGPSASHLSSGVGGGVPNARPQSREFGGKLDTLLEEGEESSIQLERDVPENAWRGVLAGSEEALVACVLRALREAEDLREADRASATHAQRAWRGHAVRLRIKHQHASALIIQRVWRGWQGRVRFAELWGAEAKRRRQAFFDEQASTIQRHFRGFHVRRAARPDREGGIPGPTDFYARKRYLERAREQNELRKQRMAEVSQQNESDRLDREVAAAKRLVEDSSHLHYLVGTAARQGVLSKTPEAEAFVISSALSAVKEEQKQKTKSTAAASLLSTTGSEPLLRTGGRLNATMGTSRRGQVAELAAVAKFAADDESQAPDEPIDWVAPHADKSEDAIWEAGQSPVVVAPKPRDHAQSVIQSQSKPLPLATTYADTVAASVDIVPDQTAVIAGKPSADSRRQAFGRRRTPVPP